ncbi:MAG TPA: CNNM domain-containing protein [Candidatus Thalassarchaeaceae archaeon]|nr:CNNM domain-containing protein [Candidatus Thalassarchaeaceae archaeon]
MSFTLLITFACVAIGVSFICSILEAVLLSTSLSNVAIMESDGKRFAHLWRKYKTEPERPLTAILTLNTIAHTVGALGVGTEVAKLYAGSPELDMIMGIASAILTLGVLLFSEILPKTIGTIYAKKLAVPAAYILQLLIIILIWIVAPIEWTRKLFPTPEQETVSREELVALVDVAEEEKTIESDEEEVIHNLLKLRDIKVRDVMTPRVVLSSVSANCTVQEVMEEKPIMVHGRMPVQGESIDEVMGLVLRSDILRRAAKDEDDITMQELMRPIHPVRPDQSVDEALDILLDYKEQLLIVKDEFGGTTGIITIEDIIETLLGREIVDESDQEGIDEGMVAEDMREFAKQRIDNGDSEE